MNMNKRKNQMHCIACKAPLAVGRFDNGKPRARDINGTPTEYCRECSTFLDELGGPPPELSKACEKLTRAQASRRSIPVHFIAAHANGQTVTIHRADGTTADA